jgi:hypothetical protein
MPLVGFGCDRTSIRAAHPSSAMPILTQPIPASQRCRPWLWVVSGVSGVVLVLLVGLLAWSWERPVSLRLGRKEAVLRRCSFTSYVRWDWQPRTGYSVGACFMPLYRSRYRGLETQEGYVLTWN